jgi:putative nucleotidyltransferase with HDIG domain
MNACEPLVKTMKETTFVAAGMADRLVETIREFSTLPTVYSSLMDALADPTATTQDVSNLIACDQASTSKVLKIVNSPLYGFPGQIDTISRAVVVLGFNEIYNLILSSYIMDFFTRKESFQKFQPVDFWSHSIAVGIATKYLGRAAGQTNQENFFIAGVLHDIGKLVFYQFAEEQFSVALDLSESQGIPLRQAEAQVFGLDHPQAGALIAENWNLPRPIVQAIRYHGEGIVPEGFNFLVAAVHAGDIVARALELGYAGDDFIPQPNPQALGLLNLKPGTLTAIVPALLEDYDEISRTLL